MPTLAHVAIQPTALQWVLTETEPYHSSKSLGARDWERVYDGKWIWSSRQ